MDEERGKFLYSGLKFLYEMELVNDPQLINNLKLNVLAVSPRIKEVDFLSSYHHKTMLIWVDLTWWGRKFYEKRILNDVHEIVQQLLPKFKFRVVSDKNIFELALRRVRILFDGGKPDAQTNNTSPTSGDESKSG